MAAVVLAALEDEKAVKPVLIYPLRDLLGFVVWVASYIGSTTHYHGGTYSIGSDGRFERINKPQAHTSTSLPPTPAARS